MLRDIRDLRGETDGISLRQSQPQSVFTISVPSTLNQSGFMCVIRYPRRTHGSIWVGLSRSERLLAYCMLGLIRTGT